MTLRFHDAGPAPQSAEPARPPAQPPGCVEHGGRVYMIDHQGAHVPVEVVKPSDKLIDQLVRGLIADAEPLAASIAAFRGAALGEVATLVDLLASTYGAKIGGKKGNVSLTTYDGCMKVEVQITDLITFGPELQAAKALVDECAMDWSADSRPEMQALINHAFRVDKTGQINRGNLFGLLRLEFADERWKRGMKAIRDSIRPIGSKEYVRFYRRPSPEAAWRPISLSAASA